MTLPDGIEDKKTRIMSLLSSPTVPGEVREEERERISALLRIERRLSRTSSLETHLSDYVEREYRRARAGDRSSELCSCRSPGCPLKDGRVPAALRTRGELTETRDSLELASEWLQDHRGDGAVLLEALERWDRLRSGYYELVESIHGRLQEARERRREELAPSPTSPPSTSPPTESEETGES